MIIGLTALMVTSLGVGVMAVLTAAHVLRATDRGYTVLTIPTTHESPRVEMDKLPVLPAIMRTEAQEAEVERLEAGKIPDVFDNLEGLGRG
jgi:hypothetical protein